MTETFVLTPAEAAEQTGLALDSVLKIAADFDGVAETNGQTLRIDPWALNAAIAANDDIRQAA